MADTPINTPTMNCMRATSIVRTTHSTTRLFSLSGSDTTKPTTTSSTCYWIGFDSLFTLAHTISYWWCPTRPLAGFSLLQFRADCCIELPGQDTTRHVICFGSGARLHPDIQAIIVVKYYCISSVAPSLSHTHTHTHTCTYNR